MKDFFRNLKINFEEFIDKLKLTDKKIIVKSVIAIVVIIAIIVSAICVAKELKDPAYSLDKTINGYIDEYISFNYYDAYEYTIIGNTSVDDYIERNYLKDLKTGQVTTDEAISAANSLTIAYGVPFFNKASVSGYNDCDSLFEWYFSNAIDATQNTSIKDYATKKVLLQSYKNVVAEYKVLTDEKLKEEYIGYDLKAEQIDVTEYSDEEVEIYIANKSDKSKKTFENAKLNYNKIKAVKRYDYNIELNSTDSRTMSVYVVKIGQKWYVDNTALIY